MENQTPIEYIIPADLLEGVKAYLMKRPWEEVAGAMPKLLALKPYEPSDKPKD